MLFTSISFLYYFLPASIIIYFITPKKYKNIILLIASLLFYFYGEPKYVFLMILEIIIAYIGAILIDKYKNQSKNILIITLFIHIDENLKRTIIYSNILVAFFNLIPIYPLDGGRILKGFIKLKYKNNMVADLVVNKISNILAIALTAISSILILYLKTHV